MKKKLFLATPAVIIYLAWYELRYRNLFATGIDVVL